MNQRHTTLASILLLTLAPACSSGNDPGKASTGDAGGGGQGSDAGGGGQGGGAADATQVSTDKGSVQGKVEGDTLEFLGIPYAAPPVGELRWKLPQPAEKWAGIRDTTKLGAACPQFAVSVLPIELEKKEDCLTLNVWSPKAAQKAKVPVMLWVHGGGFGAGSGGESLYEARALSEKTGVLVVTINYRLGPFGYLAHSGLSAESADYPTSGNYGIEDQRAAMVWVKNNIAAFGGDPDNVTIFGESAGSISICAHVTSPLSKGLFSRAILQSGACSAIALDKPTAEKNGAAFASALGCNDPATAVTCLRSRSLEDIVSKTPTDMGGATSLWGPVVDGIEWPKLPQKMLDEGDFNHVPTLLGTVKDEGTLFANNLAPGELTEAQYQQLVQSLLGPAAPPVLAQYPASAYASPKAALADLVGDVGFVCPVRRVARAISKDGTPTFLYSFAYDLAPPALPGFGVFHGSELPFLFGNAVLGVEITGEKKQMSEQMMAYWASFAKQGDPNGDNQPAWPAYKADSDKHLELNVPSVVAEKLKSAKCDFLDSLQP